MSDVRDGNSVVVVVVGGALERCSVVTYRKQIVQ